MITPEKIKAWAERQYIPFLQAWLQGQAFQPLELPVGKLPADYLDLRSEVQHLHAESRDVRGYGYRIGYRTLNTRQFGEQSLPDRIFIDTEQDLLRMLRREAEFSRFVDDVTCIRDKLPHLESWLYDHPAQVVDNHGRWPDLVNVCQYFLAHPRPNLYIRELPIPIHTKFVEQNFSILRHLLDFTLPPNTIHPVSHFERRYGLKYDEPLVRFRLLSYPLYTDLSIPMSEFSASPIPAEMCIITENKMNFLTIPLRENTFVVFGGGFRVDLLSDVQWLQHREILYWGDLDAQGFQILSQLRASFPHVRSILMDRATLEHFREFCVSGTPLKLTVLLSLTPEEHALFTDLQTANLRLEQEHITHSYMLGKLSQYVR